ncbi:MAG: hypothetical protein K2N25_04435, partial [Muribaculaceae bacterium]|nr:hypothetical protein [Muribaculaceae bacterium]
FYADAKEVKAGEDFRCGGQYFNFSLATMPDGSRLGLKFVSESTEEVKYAEGPGVGGYHPDDGRNDLQVRFPELADGRYEITPELKVDGEWSAVRIPVGQPQMIVAVVKDGVATIDNQKPASIFVTDIDLPSHIYRNHEFPMSFTVENIGDAEFYSTITPMLLDSKGDIVSKSTFRPVDILIGEKDDITDYVGKFTALKDHSLAPGAYTLIFRDEAGKNVSDPVDVTLEVNDDKTEIKVSDFRGDEKEPISDPSNVRFSFRLICESGVYYGSPKVAVFPGDGGYEIYSKRSEAVYASAGEIKEVTIDADMSELKDGSYMAVIYNGGEDMTGAVYFTIKRDNSGVDEVGLTGDAAVIYDLNGVRHYEMPASGIFIVDGKKVIIK